MHPRDIDMCFVCNPFGPQATKQFQGKLQVFVLFGLLGFSLGVHKLNYSVGMHFVPLACTMYATPLTPPRKVHYQATKQFQGLEQQVSVLLCSASLIVPRCCFGPLCMQLL